MKDNTAASAKRRSLPPIDEPVALSMDFQELPASLTSREAANASSTRVGSLELPQFLSVVEVAAVLRVDRKTVHKLIASGDLPHVRLGRVLRIPASVLQSLCKSA
jgi:excisionase family DNA binding protein